MGNPEEALLQSVPTIPSSETEDLRLDATHTSLSPKDRADNCHGDVCGKDSSVLDLSSRLITEFPGKFSTSLTSGIVSLNIEYNDICELPCGLCKSLPNLQIFRADGNELTQLPEDIGELTCLTELSVCENRLANLPESLLKLSKLRILKVSSNLLRMLHTEIGQNSELREIHAEENKLKRLPATLGLLKNLHTLIVNDNRLEQLLATIGECRNLQVVDLSRNKISRIPDSFGHLGQLVRLDFSENRITCLCDEFSSCASLETLFLDLNMIGKFPPWFQNLERIRELSMKSNDLGGAAIPEGFGFKSQHLEILDVRGNFIEILPESFCHLSSLKVLMLGTPLEYLERSPNFQNGNWLRHLPQHFHCLTSLTKLCVEENQVLSLPQQIGDLVHLEELYFGSNMLEELPASFTDLSALRICQLSKNRLKKLPEDFGALSALVELYLDSNMLRSLPRSMCELVRLEVLDLTENKLRDVPTQVLTCMTSLKALNMFYNKFEVPYSEIPYISKKTHYAEKNPEFQNTWRGRNNATNTMVSVSRTQGNLDQGSAPLAENDSSHTRLSWDDGDDQAGVGAQDSSEEEDWDSHVVASSSGSSELTHYMHAATRGDESSDEEDWDNVTGENRFRKLSSDKEQGQFDLDEDDSPAPGYILPSPVRFDLFGNSSRPMDFGVHQHRQTPYVHHAPSVNRLLYNPGPAVEGQFDSDIEEEHGTVHSTHIGPATLRQSWS